MTKIKQFKLIYSDLPRVFSLPESIYLNNTAALIPEEPWKQSKKQKAEVANVVNQLNLDRHRSCYLDVDGHRASELKSDWLTEHPNGQKTLTKGVFPSFTQGDSSAASIAELIYSLHFLVPLSTTESLQDLDLISLETRKISFNYRTVEGQAAGFSLVASVNNDPDNKHKGWIIASIHNTTANYNKRKVTVLASPNYTSAKAQKLIRLDTPEAIETELKSAINNDKVLHLIKGIFNQDGSLNGTFIENLSTRIIANRNIDDRDRKSDQMDFLFEFATHIESQDVQDTLRSVRQQMTDEIDFFKEGIFEAKLTILLNKLATGLSLRPNIGKTTDEMISALKQISERVASLNMLAEDAFGTIEKAHTYKALAQKISSEACGLKWDGSWEDDCEIKQLSHLSVSEIEKKVITLYTSNPEIQTYFRQKTQSSTAMQAELSQVPKPSNSSFLHRNGLDIGFSIISGLLVGAGMAIMLTGILAPMSIALIATGAACAVAVGVAGFSIFANEKVQTLEVAEYAQEIKMIEDRYNKTLMTAEQSLQQVVDLEALIPPQKPEFLSAIKVAKNKPLTAERVAYALWQKNYDPNVISFEKTRFTLWASKQSNLGFDIKEVDTEFNKKYSIK